MATIEGIHRTISARAARLANRLAVERGLVEAGASPFFESTHRVNGRSISLAYDEVFLVGRDAAWVKAMNDVGVEAARAAVVTHSDLVGGLIVGTARQGRNYFKEFGRVESEPAS